ncbi:MAG: methyltransferase domain-containing protein [Deltaproteobacteria bacterium]|jgi:serine/threonine-protein kinase HipA|nr:methyltransferase domain-containing protein [Deltaproteobacteria bacterium]
MTDFDEQIEALIELHRGLERQGPGDPSFSRHILSLLPELPENAHIVDLGCGAGAGALILAEWFDTTITAVDFARPFLDDLESRARAQGLDHLIKTVEADMGNLNWPPASIDLLWSEGAAYNLTFEGALKTWRPLMAPNGIAVISEITWFTTDIPVPVLEFWQEAYPQIASESKNAALAGAAGFDVLGVHRLPAQAWWTYYYDPLKERMDALRRSAAPVMQAVIEETDAEIAFFETYGDSYGYAFYLLKAA